MKRRHLFFVVIVLIITAVVWKYYFGPGRITPPPDPSERNFILPSEPDAGRIRVMSWNIRNFPSDSRPQKPDLGFSRQTNLEALQRLLGQIHTDVLGLEEIHRPLVFRKILKQSNPEARWKGVFSRLGGKWNQHVGIFWRAEKLKLAAHSEEVKSIALTENLRPGLAVYLRSRTDDGIDFSVLQVHLRAAPSGFEQRIEQYHAIADWVVTQVEKTGDEDIIVQGDFNTTGPKGGTLEEELEQADRILGASGLRRLPNASGCSEYWEGPGPEDGIQIPSLLDQVYVRGFEELETSIPLRSWLHCARVDCKELHTGSKKKDQVFWDISDHCPITFEVRDQDIDN